MKNDMEMIDVSDSSKGKDKFIIWVYIALILLIVLGLITYFFGYDLLKSYIEV
jgi:hypothetical protein